MSDPWGFGIARAHERATAREAVGELCAHAAASTGLTLVAHRASSYAELSDALERGEVGVAWMPPVPALDLVDRGAAVPIAIPARSGFTSYYSAIVVKRGAADRFGRAPGSPLPLNAAGYPHLARLGGHRIAWVQRDSASGYLIPRIHLAASGADVSRFFRSEVFLHSHADVIDAVAGGRVEAGAVFCRIDEASGGVVSAGWLDREGRPLRAVEPLMAMGPIPNDVFVVSTELPATARAAVTRWLISSDEAARRLFERVLQASDFRTVPDGHFHDLRHAIRAARARGYDALPRASRTAIRV